MQQSGDVLLFDSMEQQYTGTASVPIIAAEIILDVVLERMEEARLYTDALQKRGEEERPPSETDSISTYIDPGLFFMGNLATRLMSHINIEPSDFNL